MTLSVTRTPTMSSLEIAEITGKEHRNVLRDIRTMLDDVEIDQLSFEHVYVDAKGEERPCYRLPKDLTITLVTVSPEVADLLSKPTSPAVPAPIVYTEGNRVFATSKDVAEFFGKDHKNVLRDIDDLLSDDPEAMLNFEQGYYTLLITGTQKHRMFEMDRDGFTLLVMGFNGAKAAQFKRRYIKAFNEAIERLKELESKVALPNFNDPVLAARAWADEVEKKSEDPADVLSSWASVRMDTCPYVIESTSIYSLK